MPITKKAAVPLETMQRALSQLLSQPQRGELAEVLIAMDWLDDRLARTPQSDHGSPDDEGLMRLYDAKAAHLHELILEAFAADRVRRGRAGGARAA